MVCFEVQCLVCIVAHYFLPMNCNMLREPFQKWSCRKGTACSSVQVGYLILKGIGQHETENYNEMEHSSKNLSPFTFVIFY